MLPLARMAGLLLFWCDILVLKDGLKPADGEQNNRTES